MYSLASFAKNKVPIGAWAYFWAFYFVPLVYIFVLVPVPYCLDDCSFVVKSESGRLIPPAPFFFYKTALVILGLLCFHMNGHWSEWPLTKCLQTINAGEGVEKRECSCIAGRNVN